MAPAEHSGTPRLFISHGKWDRVLPLTRCSRSIVPQLQRAGYDVLYQEFNGIHTVPRRIAHEAIEWFTKEAVRYPTSSSPKPSVFKGHAINHLFSLLKRIISEHRINLDKLICTKDSLTSFHSHTRPF